MNKTKFMYTILTVMVFAFGFSASDEDEEAKKEREQFINNTIGTYVITDEGGVTYTLTFNSDMTMTAEANGKTYYGSWDKAVGFNWVRFKFSGSDSSEYPKIMFMADKKHNIGGAYIGNDYNIAEDGFLYGDNFYRVKEHNPDYRLKIKKIK